MPPTRLFVKEAPTPGVRFTSGSAIHNQAVLHMYVWQNRRITPTVLHMYVDNRQINLGLKVTVLKQAEIFVSQTFSGGTVSKTVQTGGPRRPPEERMLAPSIQFFVFFAINCEKR